MVTHDPYLKNFADKVVWMRDGKVGRVEHIPAEKKEAALQELRSYIASGVGKVSDTVLRSIKLHSDSELLRMVQNCAKYLVKPIPQSFTNITHHLQFQRVRVFLMNYNRRNLGHIPKFANLPTMKRSSSYSAVNVSMLSVKPLLCWESIISLLPRASKRVRL